jgi:phosphoribosylformylglycinamidine (FGAM) synthase-like enzyme
MPNQQAQIPAAASSSNTVPTPCTITPALLKQHSITPDEYTSIQQHLGRTPSLTELGIFSVMWSEHCSYKSSRVHLKRLPTKGTRTSGPGAVVQGPGENAGIIDVGDGWACAFKIESHNHPSYIEPYQGAATGVGGILRDIFTMGARPLAVMDSLRFGPLTVEDEPDEKLRSKNHHVANGIVAGVAGYGNCFGVPNLGGETRFEACYSGNPLLNAFALGLVRTDEIFYAKATGVGNPVFYVGAKTGRDGIHGATMASEEFTEGAEQKRPNVQMGDPFLEKLLLEACLEVMKTGAVLGIQDMGAAGLTCSTCEMGARGELGVSIELDRVPQRETGMSSYEIMLSESQERMLLVAEKGREQVVLDVFAKWDLDCAEVGVVTADDIMRVHHHGELIAEIPNKALTDNAPVYHRPVGTWTPPVPRDPPQWVLDELQKPRDFTADLLKLLASPNICDKRYIYEQYDSMVQTNTVQGPGFEAGVIRIKGTGPITSSRSSRPESERSADGAERPLLSETAADKGAISASWLSSRSAAEGSASLPGTVASEQTPPAVTLAEKIGTSLGLDPLAADHSVLGQLANLISGSTPEGEATAQTGNEHAANPVVAPTTAHASATTSGASRLDSETWADAPRNTNEVVVSPTAPKHERGLAMALAGNGRWCFLDPKLGAMHAVAEAARKVACTGATPVAATNCLNFGNPEKPEIMAQLSAAIDGIAEACTALNTPITGGNVSLYNETRGEGIYPTPVIGVVGLLDDVTKAVPSAFQNHGDSILLLSANAFGDSGIELLTQFGSSEYAKEILQLSWGIPPRLEVAEEAELHRCLATLTAENLLSSASDISDGGLAVSIARACIPKNIGATIALKHFSGNLIATDVFHEEGSSVLVSCSRHAVRRILDVCNDFGFVTPIELGIAGGAVLDIFMAGLELPHDVLISEAVMTLAQTYSKTLPSQLASEVVTA